MANKPIILQGCSQYMGTNIEQSAPMLHHLYPGCSVHVVCTCYYMTCLSLPGEEQSPSKAPVQGGSCEVPGGEPVPNRWAKTFRGETQGSADLAFVIELANCNKGKNLQQLLQLVKVHMRRAGSGECWSFEAYDDPHWQTLQGCVHLSLVLFVTPQCCGSGSGDTNDDKGCNNAVLVLTWTLSSPWCRGCAVCSADGAGGQHWPALSLHGGDRDDGPNGNPQPPGPQGRPGRSGSCHHSGPAPQVSRTDNTTNTSSWPLLSSVEWCLSSHAAFL